MTSPHASPHHPALLPFQRAFVGSFIQPDSAPYQLLIAPTGSGKTTVAAEIFRGLRRQGQIKRGLVLCPPQLVAQFSIALADDAFCSPPVEAVDRYRLREWAASAKSEDSLFPDSIVAVMSIHLAKQPDVAASIAATRWDLLVVDEAHLLVGQRAAMVQLLVDSGAVTRALFMTATPPREPIACDPKTTDWRQEEVWPTSGSTIEMRGLIVPYSEGEIAIFNAINGLASEFIRVGNDSIARLLLESADSSLFALEQRLLRLRNKAIHGALYAYENEDEYEAGVSQGLSLSPHILDGLIRALSMLDKVESDSKFESLVGILRDKHTTRVGNAVVILSRFADTVEYLASALANGDFEVRAATALSRERDPVSEINTTASGVISITTLAAVEGYEFADADVFVFYESARSNEFLHSHSVARNINRRLSSSLGRERPLDIVLSTTPQSLSSHDVFRNKKE